jgi:hypothetical protein
LTQRAVHEPALDRTEFHPPHPVHYLTPDGPECPRPTACWYRCVPVK